MNAIEQKLSLIKQIQNDIKTRQEEVVAKQEMLNSMMKDFATKTLGLPDGTSFDLVDLLAKAYEVGKR